MLIIGSLLFYRNTVYSYNRADNRDVYSIHMTVCRLLQHLTQASTGATTGDWLVLFTRDGCGAPCAKVTHLRHAPSAELFIAHL